MIYAQIATKVRALTFQIFYRYRVYRNGTVAEERESVSDLWSGSESDLDGQGGMVGFLLGCSFSWEQALVDAGLVPRHIEEGRNVPMCAQCMMFVNQPRTYHNPCLLSEQCSYDST